MFYFSLYFHKLSYLFHLCFIFLFTSTSYGIPFTQFILLLFLQSYHRVHFIQLLSILFFISTNYRIFFRKFAFLLFLRSYHTVHLIHFFFILSIPTSYRISSFICFSYVESEPEWVVIEPKSPACPRCLFVCQCVCLFDTMKSRPL